MADLIDLQDAQKLRDVLKNSDTPLVERKIKKVKGGSTGYTEVHPAIKDTFAVLVKNGYGSSQISDKTPDGEKRLNEFGRVLAEAKKNPETVTTALAGYDSMKLSQMFYILNKRSMIDDRYMIDIVQSKCLLGILERAIELGPHRRPA